MTKSPAKTPAQALISTRLFKIGYDGVRIDKPMDSRRSLRTKRMLRLCSKWKEFLKAFFSKLFGGKFDANNNVTYRHKQEPCLVFEKPDRRKTESGFESDLRCINALSQHSNDEHSEAVDDKLTRGNLVDVNSLEFALKQPLRVLDVDVGSRVVATCKRGRSTQEGRSLKN